MINVTKTFLPDFNEYVQILRRAWDKSWITNNGELVQELEEKLRAFLGVKYLLFCNNGTTVLQMALKVFDITKEVITTPFSYVATTNAILWENCTPVFVDIDDRNFCIDSTKIEAAITENTQAILATHVYGLPCNIPMIEAIAHKYGLRVIYDGAHAFGCSYDGKSLLNYGDISTCSFHATKLFHTVEGGCIICEDEEVYKKLFLFRQFGHIYDDYVSVGINAKNSEFHAAMGLAILPHLDSIILERKKVFGYYSDFLKEQYIHPYSTEPNLTYNYSYFPIVFKNEEELQIVKGRLEKHGVFTRRYFYPSLNTLPYLTGQACPVSEDVSSKVLCLPLYPGLTKESIQDISKLVNG